jgi:hypothetical protein
MSINAFGLQWTFFPNPRDWFPLTPWIFHESILWIDLAFLLITRPPLTTREGR